MNKEHRLLFNEYQLDYMDELASTPPEQLCWCGWYKFGKCPNKDCKKDKTLADKMLVWCSECHNYPCEEDGIITHTIFCSHREKKNDKL